MSSNFVLASMSNAASFAAAICKRTGCVDLDKNLSSKEINLARASLCKASCNPNCICFSSFFYNFLYISCT